MIQLQRSGKTLQNSSCQEVKSTNDTNKKRSKISVLGKLREYKEKLSVFRPYGMVNSCSGDGLSPYCYLWGLMSEGPK